MDGLYKRIRASEINDMNKVTSSLIEKPAATIIYEHENGAANGADIVQADSENTLDNESL